MKLRRTLLAERDRARSTAVTLVNEIAEMERDIDVAAGIVRDQMDCTCTSEDDLLDVCVRCMALAWLEPTR